MRRGKGLDRAFTLRTVRQLAKVGAPRVMWSRHVPAAERNGRHTLRGWYGLIRAAIPAVWAEDRRRCGWADVDSQAEWLVHDIVHGFLAMASYAYPQAAADGCVALTLSILPEDQHEPVRRLSAQIQAIPGLAPLMTRVRVKGLPFCGREWYAVDEAARGMILDNDEDLLYAYGRVLARDLHGILWHGAYPQNVTAPFRSMSSADGQKIRALLAYHAVTEGTVPGVVAAILDRAAAAVLRDPSIGAGSGLPR